MSTHCFPLCMLRRWCCKWQGDLVCMCLCQDKAIQLARTTARQHFASIFVVLTQLSIPDAWVWNLHFLWLSDPKLVLGFSMTLWFSTATNSLITISTFPSPDSLSSSPLLSWGEWSHYFHMALCCNNGGGYCTVDAAIKPNLSPTGIFTACIQAHCPHASFPTGMNLCSYD